MAKHECTSSSRPGHSVVPFISPQGVIVFPFETTIFLERFPLERERFLIFPSCTSAPLQRCPGRSALPREHWPYRRSGAGTKLDGELRQASASA